MKLQLKGQQLIKEPYMTEDELPDARIGPKDCVVLYKGEKEGIDMERDLMWPKSSRAWYSLGA